MNSIFTYAVRTITLLTIVSGLLVSLAASSSAAGAGGSAVAPSQANELAHLEHLADAYTNALAHKHAVEESLTGKHYSLVAQYRDAPRLTPS